MFPQITVINGSLAGGQGSTGALLQLLGNAIGQRASLRQIELREISDPSSLLETLRNSDAFVFATGTYWDSWGSPLQRFLEQITETEGDPAIWLGKPAAVVVTMHSVGGKGVLSRLQGVLSTLGCLIPPMSGMVYSQANHLALQSRKNTTEGQSLDFWRPEDLTVVAHNLLESLGARKSWKSWPVDREDFERPWFFN